MEIEPSAIDGAKSAVIYSLVARENTMERAALQSFVNQVLKQVPASYNRTLLSAIQVISQFPELCKKRAKFLCRLRHSMICIAC